MRNALGDGRAGWSRKRDLITLIGIGFNHMNIPLEVVKKYMGQLRGYSVQKLEAANLLVRGNK
jgi:hypothetical protein